MATSYPFADFSALFTRATEAGARAVAAVHGRPHVPSSGIVWQEGVVVTTDHTLRRNEDVTVTLPSGDTVPATLAGRDAGTDLAVLRISEGSTAAPKLAPESSVQAGTPVLALGRRVENGIAAAFGIVSAVAGPWRTWRGGQVERFIRPDVSIYTGFSGGALVDLEGAVIGLNTSALARGAGITLPASTISRVVADLLASGRVRRGYLGVGLHPAQLPDGREGLLILSVEPNGPAAQAGVLIGDILLTLEGQAITDTDDVQTHLGGDRIGKPIRAELVRGGNPLTLEIIPGARTA